MVNYNFSVLTMVKGKFTLLKLFKSSTMQSVKLVDICIKRMRSLPRFPTNGHVQSLHTALTEGIDDNTQLIEI